MDNLTFILLALNFLMLLAIGYKLTTRKKPKEDDQALGLLKADLTNISDNIGKLKENLNRDINDRLDKSNEMMRSSIMKQFGESSKLITEVTQKLTKLDETNKQIFNVTDELKTLQNVLSNPKQRGVLGEYYLQTVLDNVLPTGSFQMQYKFKDGETVDAVVFADRKKLIPIDSKFSLENYNRLVETKDKVERERLSAEVKKDLKLRIDETSKYVRPQENTLEFAFMFIPSEAIFYDLLINSVGTAGTSSRDLIEYAYRDKKVIIVSPTTLLAYLQTVLQGLRSLQIEEQAKDIQQRVGDLGRHISSYETFMQKLGNSLGTTVNHYNTAHKELKKVDKDIVKIAETSPGVEPLILDRPRSDD